MYAYGFESNVSTEGDMLPPVPPVPTVTSNVAMVGGIDIKGSPIMPDAGQYIPALTSPTIPFLGTEPGVSNIQTGESPQVIVS